MTLLHIRQPDQFDNIAPNIDMLLLGLLSVRVCVVLNSNRLGKNAQTHQVNSPRRAKPPFGSPTQNTSNEATLPAASLGHGQPLASTVARRCPMNASRTTTSKAGEVRSPKAPNSYAAQPKTYARDPLDPPVHRSGG